MTCDPHEFQQTAYAGLGDPHCKQDPRHCRLLLLGEQGDERWCVVLLFFDAVLKSHNFS